MAKRKTTLLITGGAGFIGSQFIKYLLHAYQEYHIINFDKLTYCGNLENLQEVKDIPRYTFIQGDICDAKAIENIARQKPDVIINFAAESHVDRSISDPTAFLKTNLWGVYTLLEAVKKHHIKKFIQISTEEVYGSTISGSFKEGEALLPSSPYSTSKASGDLLCLSYIKTYQLPVIITRSSNNFGPFQYPEKIIPLFITNLLENKKVPLYGSGQNTRDWLHVMDNCRAIDLVLHKGKEGQIYNIGGINEKTNLQLTKIILNILGKSSEYIQHVKDRPGHDKRYSLNCEKIKKLGWRPQLNNFEKALRDTVLWYQNNELWWKKIKSGKYLEYYKKTI